MAKWQHNNKLEFYVLKKGLFFGLSLWALPLVTQAELDLNNEKMKAAFDVAVERYVLENGEVVAKSLERYENNLQMKRMLSVIDKDTPLMGDLDSPVTVIEFSDYECPYCSAVQKNVDTLKKRYGNRVRFAYKHAPLSFHAKAPAASHAAMAAQEQGKFWEYSAQLFAKQPALGDKLYVSIAKDLGLDIDAFNAYRNSKAANDRLNQNLLDAAAMGMRGTPFFLINGQALSGAQPLDRFVAAIENALNQVEENEQ